MLNLQSLSTGLTANVTVNCDDAETVGPGIHSKLDDVTFVKSSIKQSDQIIILGSIKNIVRVDNQLFNIDPSKLVSRLLVLSL